MFGFLKELGLEKPDFLPDFGKKSDGAESSDADASPSPVLALAQQAAVAQPVQGRPAVLEAVRLARLEAALDDARHGSLSLNAPPEVI